MTKRRYPQFFDQVPSFTMIEFAANEEEALFRLKNDPKPKKVKRKAFISCENCHLYSPTSEGMFGCGRTGPCVNQ